MAEAIFNILFWYMLQFQLFCFWNKSMFFRFLLPEVMFGALGRLWMHFFGALGTFGMLLELADNWQLFLNGEMGHPGLPSGIRGSISDVASSPGTALGRTTGGAKNQRTIPHPWRHQGVGRYCVHVCRITHAVPRGPRSNDRKSFCS